MKLILGIFSGDENDTLIRCRSSWEYYLRFFPTIEPYFIGWKTKTDLKGQDYSICGNYGLTFSLPQNLRNMRRDWDKDINPPGYWGEDEVVAWNYRQLKFFKFCLDNYEGDYWIYLSTLTSIIDLQGLLGFLQNLEPKDIYAGMPTLFSGPENFGEPARFLYVQGSGILLSSDNLKKMEPRISLVDKRIGPDTFLGLLLKDIPRLLLPRKDVAVKKSDPGVDTGEMVSLMRTVIECVNLGFFQFRFNSIHPPFDMDRKIRAEIDPVMHALTALTLLDKKIPRGFNPQQVAMAQLEQSAHLTDIELIQKNGLIYFNPFLTNISAR
jgi:hypothetical protein